MSTNGVFSRGPQAALAGSGETASACGPGRLSEEPDNESRLPLIICYRLALLLLREYFRIHPHFIPAYLRGFPRFQCTGKCSSGRCNCRFGSTCRLPVPGPGPGGGSRAVLLIPRHDHVQKLLLFLIHRELGPWPKLS